MIARIWNGRTNEAGGDIQRTSWWSNNGQFIKDDKIPFQYNKEFQTLIKKKQGFIYCIERTLFNSDRQCKSQASDEGHRGKMKPQWKAEATEADASATEKEAARIKAESRKQLGLLKQRERDSNFRSSSMTPNLIRRRKSWGED